MKYLMFLILLCFLILAEFFIYNGYHIGWGYTACLGAIGAGILMINSVVEDRLKKAMADRVIK